MAQRVKRLLHKLRGGVSDSRNPCKNPDVVAGNPSIHLVKQKVDTRECL